MATATNLRRALLVVSLVGLVYVVLSGPSPRPGRAELDGRAERLQPTNRPTVEAASRERATRPETLRGS